MKKTTNKLNFFSTLKFLWNYIKDMRMKYILFYFGWLFQTIVGVITPIVFGNMINKIIYDNDIAAFLKISVAFLGITILGIVLHYIVYEMYGSIWNGLNHRLRMGMFEKLQVLKATRMASLNYGDMANMIHFWVCEAVHFMIRNVVHNINNILKIILCVVITFVINPVFGVVMVIMVPISVIATQRISHRIRKNSEKNRDKYSKYVGWLYEVAGSLGELRLWSATDTVLRKYDNKLNEMNQLNAKIEMDNALGGEILANIKNIILMIQYGLLAYYAICGDLSIGIIMVMLNYFTTMSDALSSLVKNRMDAQRRIAIIQNMYTFLEEDRIENDENKNELSERIKNISFEKCSFDYSESQCGLLDEIDFTVHQGEKVAIVGSSGSGKSTLLSLLMGLYEVEQGRILLNGSDITTYSKASLYEHMSIVFQQVLLFKGTIRENIQMGENVPEDEVVKACKAAGIHDYIIEQEKGYDTELEMWGKNLSGGQRQRLGIARAYVRKSDLVIMDEATSALDSDNEQLILENWDEIMGGRICIVVSHRLNTVMSCDRVVMLKNGKIHAEGTPTEMKEQCQEFRELFALS